MFPPAYLVLYPSYQTSHFFITLLLYHHYYVQAAGHPLHTRDLVVGKLSQGIKTFTVLLLGFRLINCTIYDLVIFMAPADIVIFY